MNKHLKVILIIAALVTTIMCILTGSYAKNGYDIKIGSISPRKFTATREIVNRVATQRLIDQAVSGVETLYEKDTSVKNEAEVQLNLFFDMTAQLRKIKTPVFVPYANTQSERIDEDIVLPVPLSEEQKEFLSTINSVDYNELKDIVYDVTESLLDKGIVEGTDYSLIIDDSLSRYIIDAERYEICTSIIQEVIRPNLKINEEATQKEREYKAAQVTPVMYLKNQNIVDKGEYVNEEIYTVLDDLGFVNKGYFGNIVQISGALILAGAVFFIAIKYVSRYHISIVKSNKSVLILFSLYMLCIIFARMLVQLPYFVVPILVFSLLVAVLLSTRLAILFAVCVTLVCSFIFDGGLEFIIFYSLTGIVMTLFSTYATERNKIILIAIIQSAANALIVVGITFFLNKEYSPELLTNVVYAVLSGIASVILAIGSLPLWESVFGVLTPIRLMELTNPNNPVLRRLILEAPGTYHHSLIVANLAETASFDIGANSDVARIGGYYHDIGKLLYPSYFSENQLGVNIHDSMSPIESVNVITAHVTYGLKLAEENKLPKIIRNIIVQHHGRTTLKFFYFKAKKESEETGVQIDENDFRYKNGIPSSKEAAVVMLADTVEAAVRSMVPTGKTMDEVEEFIKKLIKDKLDDGQLDDSGLAINDIITIRQSFMRVFKGMYHERIAYPTADKEKKKE